MRAHQVVATGGVPRAWWQRTLATAIFGPRGLRIDLDANLLDRILLVGLKNLPHGRATRHAMAQIRALSEPEDDN